ncbi:MAG: delta-class carbonic anhydrase [Litoreibacter sp.]
MNTKLTAVAASSIAILGTSAMSEGTSHEAVADDVIAAQRAALASSTDGAGFGPQSPRDIGVYTGANTRSFGFSPSSTAMNLCNIHFHENAEHRGGEFTSFAGNGDGHGYNTGFKYDGALTDAQLAPLDKPIGKGKHGDLEPGDTIEVHFVYTTAQVNPGPTLGSCLSEAIGNPQLRVETQVMVLVNDESAADFTELAEVKVIEGYHQAPNVPSNMGTPVEYTGSTTGPSYNEVGSPFQVTWSVRPKVAQVNIHTVGTWLGSNVFDESYAHGVRNLVVNPNLLSSISQ